MKTVQISDIKIGPRLRNVDTSKRSYQQLKQDIKENGVVEPIVLLVIGKNRPRLAAGMHRLTAMRELGRTELRHGHEFVILDTEGLHPRQAILKSQMAEVSENLFKVQLAPMEGRQFEARALAIGRRMMQHAQAMAIEKDRKEQARQAEIAKAAKAKAEAEAARAKAATDAKAKADAEAARRKAEQEAREAELQAESARKRVLRYDVQQEIRTKSRQPVAISSGSQEPIARLGNPHLGIPATTADKFREMEEQRKRKEQAGVNKFVADQLGVSERTWLRRRMVASALDYFITLEELAKHPISKKINQHRDEYRTLEDMAGPAQRFYHDGLRKWSADVKAGKHVDMPSRLKERIKEENAELKKAELANDARASWRDAQAQFTTMLSHAKNTRNEIRDRISKSVHPHVRNMANAEIEVLHKVVALLEAAVERNRQRQQSHGAEGTR